MLRLLYLWVLRLAEHRLAVAALVFIAFIESSVFPITPIVILVPMVLARPDRAWLLAGICTAASVAGGVFGWWLGHAFYAEIGRPVLEFYGKAGVIEDFASWFHEVGAEAVIFAALTPFPYKVVTLASGVTNLPIGTLIWASIVGRGLQFFSVAALLWLFGARAKALIERHMATFATATAVLIVGGFALVRLIGQ